ncbi:MAG: tetratricopeptide repeat protein [Bdellovibrionales bacterium]|nr:tetratricopeptide repeat protein [Bdellovibrionales bacterium]
MSTTSTHIDRKALKQQDEFFKSTKSIFDHLAENSKAVGIAGAGLLVLAGAWMAYSAVQESKEGKARDALYVARQSIEKELQVIADREKPTQPPATKGKDGKEVKSEPVKATLEDVAYKKLDVAATFPESQKKLTEVFEKHSGTRAAFEARLAMGDLFYDHGQAENAIAHYEAASKIAPKAFEKAMAFYALAYANENAGKYGDAAAAFDRALSLGETSLRAELLTGLGRVHGLNKNVAEANKALDKVISEFPTSDHAKAAELLKSQFGSGK